MISFTDLILKRRSTRSFDKKRKVSRKDLELCASAGRLAPSACNSQPWKMIIIDTPENISYIKDHVISGLYQMNSFAGDASAFIAICSQKNKFSSWLGGKLKGTDFKSIDIGGCCEYIVLQAEDLGVASCILGWFNARKLKRLLSIPFSIKIELLIALGYPEKIKYPEKIRKTKNDVISFNKY